MIQQLSECLRCHIKHSLTSWGWDEQSRLVFISSFVQIIPNEEPFGSDCVVLVCVLPLLYLQHALTNREMAKIVSKKDLVREQKL